jgi:hypothetical protein
MMVIRLLGNFGRYSVQPFRILYVTGNDNNDNNNEDDDDEEADGMPMTCCMAYHTLTGGHFDGKLRFSVEETTKDNSCTMVVSMTLAIPDGSRAPPVRLAKVMALLFAHSIAQSIWIQTEQTLARRRQSRGYQEQASGRALVKWPLLAGGDGR